MAKGGKKSLLDDDDDVPEAEMGIQVNKEYAARFEHNKRREEMHRLQEKHPELADKLARQATREAGKGASGAHDEDEDDSEAEEEDDGDIPDDTEAQIFQTLLRIKRQDPAIYKPDVAFFEDEDDEHEEEQKGGKEGGKRSKPLYLKDMIAKQALEHGAEIASSDDDEEERGGGRRSAQRTNPKVYNPEQEALRSAFLQAAEEAAAGEEAADLGGVLRKRARALAGRDEAAAGDGAEQGAGGEADGAGEAPGRKKQKQAGKQKGKAQVKELLDEYFGSDEQLDDGDRFLKEYILNKGWVDREDDYVPSYHEIVGDDDEEEGVADLEEDEQYLERTDKFEHAYNFRYEEPGAERIMTHPRVIGDTVRKPDDTRRRAREAKKARQEEAEAREREEVKRLKNLKKQEIEDKLGKLHSVAGKAAPSSLDAMLDGDFDPEEWDKKMAEAFDDEYYNEEEDVHELFGSEDDALGLMESDDEEEGGRGGADGAGGKVTFRAIKKKLQQVDAAAAAASEEPEGEDDDDDEAGGRAGGSSEAAARQRAELQRLLEEYYKLDYEDEVGGVKTRFRYKEVPASTFGLSVDDILALSDKELNQVVGMKRLAPYREDVDKLRPNYKALQMIKGDAGSAAFKQRRQYKKREGGWGASGSGKWQQPQQQQGWQRSKGSGEAGTSGRGAAGGEKAPRDDRPGEQRRQRPEAEQQQQGGGAAAKQQKGERAAAASGNAGRAGGGGDVERPAKRSRAEGGGQQGQGHGHGHGGQGHSKPAHQQVAHHQGGHHQWREMDPEKARLASFAVPTLRKEGHGAVHGDGGKAKKKKKGDGGAAAAAAAQQDGPQLTRAQKKNQKRAQKRAAKRE